MESFRLSLNSLPTTIDIQNENGYVVHVTCVDMLSNRSGKELFLIFMVHVDTTYMYRMGGFGYVMHACADLETVLSGRGVQL